MKHARLAIISGAILFLALPVLAQMTPVGLWRNIDDKTGQAKAEIRIKTDSQGVLSGVIEKALVTSSEPLCVACTDDRQGKPKLGLEVIRGAKKAEGKDVWEDGKILDPDNGRNYSLRLTPVDGGAKLEVRGSFGPFGRTQTWVRIQ
ncbi:DUF2147 domain-containing protein [Polaromonas sp. UC242_47]|uniref:DUF2147 domain-containing protein n=1 Tax=Polaromonas sp. UC242_47 TaxID=3374626 RepID=UPI00378EEF4C